MPAAPKRKAAFFLFTSGHLLAVVARFKDDDKPYPNGGTVRDAHPRAWGVPLIVRANSYSPWFYLWLSWSINGA
ncbi:hypothetical protein ACG7TL_006727 [Trametes sanguinea]